MCYLKAKTMSYSFPFYIIYRVYYSDRYSLSWAEWTGADPQPLSIVDPAHLGFTSQVAPTYLRRFRPLRWVI